MTVLPGETSQSVTFAVRSNSLVPSGRTVGAMIWAPTPAVFAGNDLVTSAILLSMALLASVLTPPVLAAAEVPPPPPTMSIATIPAPLWPGIAQ